MNRGLPRALLGCAVGGVLVLIAQAVTWSRAAVTRPTGGVQHVSVSGHDVAAGLPAIGWALLALALAMLAATGVMRRVVGVLVMAVGAGGVATAVVARGEVSQALAAAAYTPPAHPLHASAGPWWVVAALGGLVAALAGATAVARGGRWGGMGARYEPPAGSGSAPVAGSAGQPDPDERSSEGSAAAVAPSAAAQGGADDSDAWRALDRGEDPTLQS